MDPFRPEPPDIWARVDALIERADTISDLRWHRLHLYAAWRWRSLGRRISDELHAFDRQAAALRLSMPTVLARVREAYDGPIVLLKGADVAARYPTPELRPSADLDLLVPDAEHVYRALVNHGFNEWQGEARLSAEHHHLQLLVWPGLPGGVEIHRAPNWPTWLTAPRTDELISEATSESVVGHGILTLPPAHHALVLTAHLWRDDPMGRVGQLIDVLLMSGSVDGTSIEKLARRWGIERLWRTTRAAAHRILLGEQDVPLGARVLTSRHESMRQRTVLESKVFEICAPFFGLPPSRAITDAARHVIWALQPGPNETWGEKATALRQSLSPISVAANRGLEKQRRRKLTDYER